MAEAAYHHGNLREALLDRAVEVITEKGVEGLSLRGLARDLGVSHAAPARHFKSKAELLAAIVTAAYDRMTEATLSVADEAGEEPVDRLRAIAKGTVRWAIANRGYYSAMMNPDVSRFADEELKTSLANYIKMIAEACAEAQSAGLYAGEPLRGVLLYGIATTIGSSLLFTDGLLGEILGPLEDDGLIDEIIERVIPIEAGR